MHMREAMQTQNRGTSEGARKLGRKLTRPSIDDLIRRIEIAWRRHKEKHRVKPTSPDSIRLASPE